MSRHVVRTVLTVIIFIGVSSTLVYAQLSRPSSTEPWCDAPTVVPAAAVVDGEVQPAPGITVARGGVAVSTSNGPAIRLPEGGARAQIDLGRRLYNTQWLIADVDPDDGLRIDLEALRGDRNAPLVEISGALSRTDADGGRSIETTARPGDGEEAQITVRTVSQVALLTNDGGGPIDVVGVVGCAPLTASVETLDSPSWDASVQRFVASYEVVIENNLVSDRTLGFLALGRGSAPTTIDALALDIDVREAGYRTAVVRNIDLPRRFRPHANPDFDGFDDVRTLASGQVVSDGDPLVAIIDVFYEPDFEDSAWDSPMAAPSPTVRVSGSVDGVAVSTSATRDVVGTTIEGNVDVSTVSAPRPGLTLDHRYAVEPTLASDGTVRSTEYITVANAGQTQLSGLALSHDLVDLFGEGMWLQSINFRLLPESADACQLNDRFDGDARTRLLSVDRPVAVGERCVVELITSAFPGTVPGATPTLYESVVASTARSGVRAVEASQPLDFSLASNASASIELVDVETTTNRDGSYTVSGDLEVGNTGTLDLSRVTSRIDITVPTDDGVEARNVSFTNFSSTGNCEAAGTPNRTRTGASLLPGGQNLVAETSCTIRWEFVAWPGVMLEDWTITASAFARTPRGRELVFEPVAAVVNLQELPAVELRVDVRDVQPTAAGGYAFTVDTEVVNAGDTPLTSIDVEAGIEAAFGDRLRSSRVLVDGCSRIDGRRPLWPSESSSGAQASQAERPTSCVISTSVVAQPGNLLSKWSLEAFVQAVSTSGQRIETTTPLELEPFVEAPALVGDLAVTHLEKLDEQTYRIVVLGSMTNAGDVTLFGVGAPFDLGRTFGSASTSIEWTSSEDLTMNPEFDGREDTLLLEGDDALFAGETATFRVSMRAAVGGQRDPLEFLMAPTSVSPALRIVRAEPVTASRSVPAVETTKRATSITNNGDGTYDVSSLVSIRNSGSVDLSWIDVSTDLLWRLRHVQIGEATIENTCNGSGLPVASFCSHSVSATVRPGVEVGPYDFDVTIAAADQEGSVAVRTPEPVGNFVEAEIRRPVAFSEAPSLGIEVQRSEPVNNNDGTYTVEFATELKNTGDVPMYRVDFADGPTELFAGMLVVNDRTSFGCTSTSFRLPLRPGDTCRETSTVVVRPGSALGPWVIPYELTATSPSGAQTVATASADSFVFDETLDLTSVVSLVALANNGDGSYNVGYSLSVTNDSDVPLIAMAVDHEAEELFGDRVDGRTLREDSCNVISGRFPLAPGGECVIDLELRVIPGQELGPWVVNTSIHAESPSGEFALDEVDTEALTLQEAPSLDLATEIKSVENVGSGAFRVVVDLDLANSGDVRLDDVNMRLDLADAFTGLDYRVDGLISRDVDVEPEFSLGETDRLLIPGQGFWVGREATVTLVLTVTPGEAVGPFTTALVATGTSPAQVLVELGIDAAVDLPAIDLHVTSQFVENNRDGTYSVTTTYRVENRGTTVLENLRLVEELDEIYTGVPARLVGAESPDVATVEIGEVRRDFELVAFGEQLATGETATVSSSVIVTPGNALGPFLTSARAVGVSPAGTAVGSAAVSQEEVVFVEQPALRVEQRLVNRPIWNSSGRFDVTFAIDVFNDGDVELRALQVREDLLQALGWNSSIIVRDVRSDELTTNFPGYDGLGRAPTTELVDEVQQATGDIIEPEEVADGSETEEGDAEVAEEPVQVRDFGDTRLLSGFDTLAAGDRATIEIDLTVAPETRGIYNTRVNVSARTPAGTGLGSDDLIAATTITRLTVQGELGVAKRVLGEPFIQPDGSVAVTYEILVANVGPFPLTNVEVHDQLSKAFGLTSSYVTSRVRTAPDSACAGATSSSFDGGAIDPVLVSGVTLQPEQSCSIEYDAFVRPSEPLPGPFRSSAFAIASDPFAGTVIDDSTDGTNPDPDGNQEPGDNDIATPVTVEVPVPMVELEVMAETVEPSDREGWFDVSYRLTATNEGAIDVILDDIKADLDAAWEDNFDLESIESSSFPLIDDFDGDGQIDLVETRTVLPAGESASLVINVSVERPASGESTMTAVLRGQSAADRTRVLIESSREASLVEFPEPRLETSSTLFGDLSQEEARLLLLGAGAFAIIGLAFLVRTIRRFSSFRSRRSRRRAFDQVVIDLRESETIDLRRLDKQARPPRMQSSRGQRRRRSGKHGADHQGSSDRSTTRQRATRP